MRGLIRSAIWLVALAFVAAAEAQTPAQDSATGPALQLTPAQQQTIYQSISKTQKNAAAPAGFRASVGAHVPDTVELQALPDALEALIPDAKGYDVAMIEKQVVLVDPLSRTVAVVVTAD
jgi:glucose/arabinose dehydrogenase